MTAITQYGPGQAPPWPRTGGENDRPRDVSLEELARAWLDPKQAEWAIQDATERCYQDPKVAWEFIGCLVRKAVSDDDLGRVAVGPLEDFVQTFAQDYIDRIENLAKENATFKKVLTGVWFSGRNDIVTGRLTALGCYDVNSHPTEHGRAQPPRGGQVLPRQPHVGVGSAMK